MNQTSTGSNRVEVKMVFTSDASKATSELSKIAMSAKNVDMAAKEAQKNLERMNGPNGASKINAPAFPSTVRDSQGNTHSVQAWQSAQKRNEAARQREEEAKAMQAMGGQVAGPKAGLNAEGAIGLSGAWAKAAGSLAVVITAANVLSRGMNAMADASKSTAQKIAEVGRAVPIIGESGIELGKAFVKWADRANLNRINQAEEQNQVFEPIRQVQFSNRMKLQSAQDEASSVLGSLNGDASIRQGIARVPVEGQDERITNAKIAEEAARKASMRAKEQADLANKRADEISNRVNGQVDTNAFIERENLQKQKQSQEDATKSFEKYGALGRFARARADDIGIKKDFNISGFGSDLAKNNSPLKGIDDEINAQQRRKELGRSLIEQEEALKNAKEKSINAASKLNEYERARTETMKAQAQLLKDQYMEAKGQEQEFGLLDDEKKQEILDTQKKAKESGFAALDTDERNLLLGNSATSKYAREEAAKLGEKDDRLAQIRELTGGKSSKDIGEELKDISAKIDVKINLDESELERAVKNAFEKFLAGFSMLIEKSGVNSSAQIESDAAKQKALQAIQ